MKALLPLTAVAVLATSISAQAYTMILEQATVAAPRHMMVIDAPMFKMRPAWSYRIDRSILHPVPRPIPMPFPWPGPVCLSCPSMQFDEHVISPRVILR